MDFKDIAGHPVQDALHLIRFQNLVWVHLSCTPGFSGILESRIRITSYNVCYTKLLRCGLSGLFLPALAEQQLIVEAGFAPPYYTVDGEKVSGILVDMVSRVLDEAGIPFSIKAHPTKRVYRNLINGTGHIFLGPLKPEFPDFSYNFV